MRPRNRLAFSRPRPYARVPVLMGCPDHTWPARCSRDTAMVAVFRLAPSHPSLVPKGSHHTKLPAGGREEHVPKGGERGDACPSPEESRVREVGSWPQWPERAPRQGCEGSETHQRRVRAPVRRASESLNVRQEYDQQRRTRCGAWCEKRARAAAGVGAARLARGVIVSTINR